MAINFTDIPVHILIPSDATVMAKSPRTNGFITVGAVVGIPVGDRVGLTGFFVGLRVDGLAVGDFVVGWGDGDEVVVAAAAIIIVVMDEEEESPSSPPSPPMEVLVAVVVLVVVSAAGASRTETTTGGATAVVTSSFSTCGSSTARKLPTTTFSAHPNFRSCWFGDEDDVWLDWE